MIEGDANGRGFQYPIPTYSITKEFDWSATENNRLLFEMTAKYGTPYFSNYINSDMKPSDVRSMCCRLRLDLRELRKKSGGFFGSGESTGSIGVVTLNLPRIAYLSQTKEEFYATLDKYMDIAARSLSVKRKVISRLMDEGLYPYTRRYLGTFKNHFSTIGMVGMNEAILNAAWLKDENMTTEKGRAFAIEVLNHMRTRLSDYQEQYGDLYNLEATPAESTSYRFAKHDTEEFPGILTAAKDGNAPYYTNSSHLPVGYTDDIFDALELEDELQTLPPRTPSVRNTVTSGASTSPVRNADATRKCTPASPGTTARFGTGTTARSANSRTARPIIPSRSALTERTNWNLTRKFPQR